MSAHVRRINRQDRIATAVLAVFATAVMALSGAYCDRKMAAPRDSGTLMSSVRISR